MRTKEEIEKRLSEIAVELEKPDANLDALEEETRSLKKELENLESAEKRREELRKAVAAGTEGRSVRNLSGEEERRVTGADSPEYRIAFLKNLAVRDGRPLFGEMTPEERSAFITTTANTGNVVPSVMLNRIIDLVESMAPMYDDSKKSNLTQGFSVPRRTAIAQGDAATVSEGTANDDEQNTFDLLALDGCEIKKHIVISRKMQFKSIDAFESWVVEEISKRIAVAKEGVIIARLNGSTPTGGTQISGSGIDSSTNILTAQPYTDAAIRGLFALLKGAGRRVLYANNKTIWTYLIGIADEDGHKLFVPNSMDDPVVAGRIYGALVKEDENLSDNVVYLGAPDLLLSNDYDDLTLFNAVEPKTANQIVTGYSLFDAGLENPKGWVKATFTPGP